MPHPSLIVSLLRILTGLICCLVLTVPAFGSSNPVSSTPYRLFVGIDVEVMHEGDFRTIDTIVGGDAVVTTAEGATTLPFREIKQVKFDYGTKLSPTVINLERVEFERAYSPARDPRWEARSQQVALQGYRQDQISVRQAGIANATLLPTTPDFGGPPGGNAPTPAPDSDPVEQAYSEYESYVQSTEHFDSIDAYPSEGDEIEGDGDFDAINVSFVVSSPLPIARPYIVAIARFRDADYNLRDKFWFREIDRIDEQAREFKMATAGLPPGFEIESVRLHVFRHGSEIATNESERQIPLSTEEAHQYLLLAHQSDHADATMAAQPVWSLAPPELLKQSPREIETWGAAVAVWVDEDGKFERVAADQVVPPTMAEMLPKLFYLPALADGRPVKGLAQVDMAEFTR